MKRVFLALYPVPPDGTKKFFEDQLIAEHDFDEPDSNVQNFSGLK